METAVLTELDQHAVRRKCYGTQKDTAMLTNWSTHILQNEFGPTPYTQAFVAQASCRPRSKMVNGIQPVELDSRIRIQKGEPTLDPERSTGDKTRIARHHYTNEER